ncbi:MAG: ABC transporter substrate-binding protein [Hyphomicrobiales bacterium]|nr:ABC transporter substrate-binding protein [Hyphomicrobiales bacterium]
MQTGTLKWELGVINKLGLAKAAGLNLQTQVTASPEAQKIALLGGTADIIVSDWLFVSRERAAGRHLKFYPYSSAVGAVMVRKGSPMRKLADLKGKKLAVAGGPLDKSWLLLQAYGQKRGFDVKHEANLMFGAPPLLQQKTLQGEADASLNFWNFSAALEGKGFRPLVTMAHVERKLGAKGKVAMLGYVFTSAFAKSHKAALDRFLALTRKAKGILASTPADWAALGPHIGAPDAVTQALFRRDYSAGIPARPIADEQRDAATLFDVLARTGGTKLVGAGKTLDPGTYYTGMPGS